MALRIPVPPRVRSFSHLLQCSTSTSKGGPRETSSLIDSRRWPRIRTCISPGMTDGRLSITCIQGRTRRSLDKRHNKKQNQQQVKYKKEQTKLLRAPRVLSRVLLHNTAHQKTIARVSPTTNLTKTWNRWATQERQRSQPPLHIATYLYTAGTLYIYNVSSHNG